MRHELAHNNKLVANRNRNRIDGHHTLTQRVEVEEVGSSATISGKQRTVEDETIGKDLVLTNTLLGHTAWVMSVAYNTAGTQLASGSWDNTIKIWDMSNGGELLQTLTGHTEAVNSVVYNEDSTHLASGSADRTIKIWDMSNGGELLQTLTGHTEWIWSVAYNEGGTQLASGSHDYTIKIWECSNCPADKDSAVTQSLSITTIAILVSASIFSLCLGIFCFSQRRYIVDFIRSRIIRSRTGNKGILEHNLTGGTFELVESELQNQASRQTVID